MRPYLVVAALLAGSLAGCFDQDSGVQGKTLETVEPISSVTVEAAPGVRVAENRGALQGGVINDQGLPINGALITLANTSHYANSDAKGEFLITNIVPGTYVVRAERAGFRVAESEVVVTRANVTNVILTLVPVAGDAGNRPHLHDFWADETEVLLMDEDVDLTKDPGGGYGALPWPVLARVYYPNSNQTINPPGWPLFLPEGNDGGRPPIILPGTAKILVTFSWSQPDVIIDRLSLAYQHPLDKPSTFHVLPPVASGTTQVVEVNASIADTGHQTFTLWKFWVHAGNAATASGYKPALVNGEIHVKMVLVKAEVLLEPEHPDHWADGDMLVLRNKSAPFKVPSGSLPFYTRDNAEGAELDAGRIVPPGAKKMRIELAWTYPQDAGPLNFEHDLSWRTGDQPPRKTARAAFHTETATQNVAGVNGKKVWEFDLEPAWTDTFYQKKSNWLFAIDLNPQPDDALYHVEPRPHDVTLEVTVWKDPAYG